MKRVWILLPGFFSLAAKAQTVSISVNGERNQQVIVNNVTYDIDNNNITNPTKNIRLANLRPGEYTLQLVRINDNNLNDDPERNRENPSRLRSTTTFTVRPGFDVAIVIMPNGIVQVKEKQIIGTTSDPMVMDDATFTALLDNIRYSWRSNRRIAAAQSALTNNNNYFSTQQVLQIIGSVEGDPNRLALARMAYSRTTDPSNFVQVYSMLSTPAGRDELSGFIRQSSGSNMIYSYSESFRQEMGEVNFEALLRKLKLTIDPSLRANAVTEVISNTTNYFTVSQARRLVEMVEQESIRLQLLKDVYTHITDPVNFSLMYPLLATDVTKIELINYVRAAAENGGLVNYNLNKPALEDKAFNAICDNAVAQAQRGNLVLYLTNALGDFGNYFTAAQATKLIALVDGELNRLSLAKAAYRGVTDPENYLTQMNDLLGSAAARNELSIYAYSYREK